MKKALAAICIVFGALMLGGLVLLLLMARDSRLADLDVAPDHKVRFYAVGNFDLGYDIRYVVYKRGKRVYCSPTFFYSQGQDDTAEFSYYEADNRYVGIFDKDDRENLVIVMDLASDFYGKFPIAGPTQQSDKMNAQAINILKILRREVGRPSLHLDEFHYNWLDRGAQNQ